MKICVIIISNQPMKSSSHVCESRSPISEAMASVWAGNLLLVLSVP